MDLPRHLGICAVVALQLAVLAAIPSRAIRARAQGADVTLWTEPVDPYDLLSGYHVTLAYEAERMPGGAPSPAPPQHAPVWVTVRRGDPAWTPVSVTVGRPAPAADEVSLRATWNGRRAAIDGCGRLYVPETRRARADELLRAALGRALVDLSVADDGHAAVLRLRVGGETFGE